MGNPSMRSRVLTFSRRDSRNGVAPDCDVAQELDVYGRIHHPAARQDQAVGRVVDNAARVAIATRQAMQADLAGVSNRNDRFGWLADPSVLGFRFAGADSVFCVNPAKRRQRQNQRGGIPIKSKSGPESSLRYYAPPGRRGCSIGVAPSPLGAWRATQRWRRNRPHRRSPNRPRRPVRR